MSFFNRKKDDDKRADLPELPGMKPSGSELPPLPSFPKTQMGDSTSLSMIKSSIGEPSQSIVPPLRPEADERLRRIEASDWQRTSPKTIPNPSMLAGPRTVSKEPVFVKIDKFKDVIKKFDDIKSKVAEIDLALHKIRELKEKEELELKSWEQEAELIKEKIKAIDDSLFNKI